MADVIFEMLKKCAATMSADLEALTPKDRIMLWKEYGSYYRANPSGSGLWASDRGNQNDGNPGLNVSQISVSIISEGGDGNENG